MGDKKIIEMPKDSKSSVILSTFAKIKKYNQGDLSYISELTIADINNIEAAYSAACIYSALGMFNEEQQIAAKMQIESLVGDYSYSVEMYRLFVRAYGNLLKYNANKNENCISNLEQNDCCCCKLA